MQRESVVVANVRKELVVDKEERVHALLAALAPHLWLFLKHVRVRKDTETMKRERDGGESLQTNSRVSLGSASHHTTVTSLPPRRTCTMFTISVVFFCTMVPPLADEYTTTFLSDIVVLQSCFKHTTK